MRTRLAWRTGAVTALVVGALAWSAASPPAAGPPGAEWRLDDFTRTYPPNAAYGKWNARKFSPLLSSGETYFYQFVHDGAESHHIVLRSGQDNSFSLGVETPFRLQQWPIAEWDWRMIRLPKGGDVRHKERDDQAGAVCIVVKPGLTGFDSLCYLFENDGPKDTPITSTRRADSRYLILRTAAAGDPLGTWLHERRNVLADYKRVFGKDPKDEAVLGFQIDSNDTQSAAEAHYRNIYLRRP